MSTLTPYYLEDLQEYTQCDNCFGFEYSERTQLVTDIYNYCEQCIMFLLQENNKDEVILEE